MKRRWVMACMAAMLVLGMSVTSVGAASTYGSAAFQSQWQQGEAITPNFWGPLASAKDGQQEPYKEASGGQRLVQYFDKGRMESTNGSVTNGLLATEIVKGQVQTGDATFQAQPSPAIPIAGDPDNAGPTYAQLGSKAKPLFDAAPSQAGNAVQAAVSPGGDISVSGVGRSDQATFVAYDEATKHNVPKAFADYRAKAGLSTIGLALCEPFYATVRVGGQPKQVMVQVFERRVLTYTDSNPDAFKVEMGNIGQHYYRWRYGAGSPPAPAPQAAASPAPTVAPTPVPAAPAAKAPTDDTAYAQYLKDKYGSIGGHKIALDKVTIDHLVANTVNVDFEAKSDEVTWMYNSASKADLQAWGVALLAELKGHWPGQTVLGVLDWSYYTFTFYENSDCHYRSDNFDVDLGWYNSATFVEVYFNPTITATDSVKVCAGK